MSRNGARADDAAQHFLHFLDQLGTARKCRDPLGHLFGLKVGEKLRLRKSTMGVDCRKVVAMRRRCIRKLSVMLKMGRVRYDIIVGEKY